MTPKQGRFVDEYMIDLNATQAAIRAGYAEASASETGYALISNPQTAAAIAERQQALADRTAVTQDDVASRLADIAFTDMTDVAEWGDGRFALRDSKDLTPAAAAAVKKLKVKRRREVTGSSSDPMVWEVESIELELEDRLKAAELYGKHVGMWPQRPVEVNATITLEIQQRVMEWRRIGLGDALDMARQLAPGLLGDDEPPTAP